MKKIVFTLLLLLPLLSLAQVGVNTTTPKAALDVESTNNGILIPRVQLTSISDIVTVVNPNLGPLETSTLVYNIAAAGVIPNNVVAGFYYWNGTIWTAIAGTATADHDWYEEGTTTAPTAITDDMFHTGNVAIGKNTADYPLEVNTTNFQFGINNTFNNPTVTGVQKATINNFITDTTNDRKYGIINTITNNSATSGGIGTSNSVNGDGVVFYGTTNNLNIGLASTGADIIGIRNFFFNNSNNNVIKGMYNLFQGSGGNFNFIHGTQNDFRVTALEKRGTYNVFNANTDGDNIGLVNDLNSDLPLNNQTGVLNSFTTGAATIANNLGINNVFNGDGSGAKTGVSTTINSSGNGEHTGAVQIINGSVAGLGTKYGTRTVINPTAGGTHYGIHSTVLKPGATNFAGYFLGNVGIGTTTLNTYTFPPSRGTDGQVMRTDGSGLLTWQNPSAFAWSLNGNASTNPAASFINPITTENFIGTTDNQNLMLGTNNRGRFLIYANGGILTGRQNTSIVGGPNPDPSLNVYTISTGPGNEVFTGSSFGSIGINNGTNIAATFFAYQATNNYAIIVPSNSGLVGIGTATPTTTLHIENTAAGAIRIVDGTQATGRVLTSDATGVATWQSLGTLGSAWTLNGNSAINTPTVPATYGTSVIGAGRNFMGTTTLNDVVIATNTIERMRVKTTTGFVGVGTANPSTPFEVTSFGINEFRLSSRSAFGTTRFSMISDKELATEWRPSYIESGDNGGYTGRMDFYTNGTGVANRFGTVRAMSIVNGNVGINTINPSLAKLQVDAMVGNTTAVFRGFAGGQGISMVSDWPGIYFNSYYNGGIRAMAGNGYASIINTNQNIGGLDFQTTDVSNPASGSIITPIPLRMRIAGNGNIGIGEPLPTNLLHINSATSGAVRIVDGTQADNRILTSDVNGVATWTDNRINNISGILGSGVNIPFGTGAYLQTNSYIDLPPGRWVVNVAMLLRNTTASYTPNNSYFWLRTTFSESSGPAPTPTPDLSGSTLLSGNFMPSSVFSVIQGALIINNPSLATKRYYYVAGNTQFNATSDILHLFGGNAFLENNILAYRLN